MVQDAAFTGYEEETQPFMFGWDLDQNGNPIVYNGSDEKPFLVGLNQVSYPVLVIGMSDREQRFHLLAVMVLSQIVEEMYTKALAALRRVFEAVTNKPLRVYCVMGDADDGLKVIDESGANRVRKDIYDLHFAENRSDFYVECESGRMGPTQLGLLHVQSNQRFEP
ncbi:hypothetical protein PC119_g15505 [Phytophthora cactorum]|nr:hypothetical protein PC119_g15505 [Phytophthora cactorum]